MGCEYQTLRETPQRQSILTQLASEGKLKVEAGDGTDRSGRDSASRGYAVRLATYRGGDRSTQGFETVRLAKEEAGLADLWVLDRSGALSVYHGRFSRPSTPAAKAALRAVQEADVGGERPFGEAALVPLGEAEAETAIAELEPNNLRRFAGRGLLTLQIAVYDEAFGPGFRAAAEQAVAVLREEGEEAYFYHGPFRSMVTLDLFNFEDHFTQVQGQRAYGPEIRALRERHPYNLVNGLTVVTKNKRGESLGEQQSKVIRIP